MTTNTEEWKKDEEFEKFKSWAVVIANMVYGYQGSDPQIIKKQTGRNMAAWELKDIVSHLLQEREEKVREEERKRIRWEIDSKITGEETGSEMMFKIIDVLTQKDTK